MCESVLGRKPVDFLRWAPHFLVRRTKWVEPKNEIFRANRQKSAGERPKTGEHIKTAATQDKEPSKTKLSFDQEAKLIHYEQNVSQNSVFLGKTVVLYSK